MSAVEVQIMRLPHGMDLPLPAYQSAQAAGLDLLAPCSQCARVDRAEVGGDPDRTRDRHSAG